MITTTGNERLRLSAISNYFQSFFTNNSINGISLVGSTLLSPPEVMDKIYVYVNPERYFAMDVDNHSYTLNEDGTYQFTIGVYYHASYSIDIYGKEYDAFDYAKTLRSLLYPEAFSGLGMGFMDCHEILNLTNTNLSDSLVFQRFKFVANFMQNDIINVRAIGSINQIEVKGILSGISIDVVVGSVDNGVKSV
jgi:hypothetical protein